MQNDFTIFYSWQMDVPVGLNKDFIRSALNDAIEKGNDPNEGLAIEDSPRVDSGMEGVPGTPEVASVMFEKIEQSSLFLADLTLTGVVGNDSSKRKMTSNPNVNLEMGYAAAKLNWDRVICVMNEHFGKRDELPFDVKNRRFPITYTLGSVESAGKQVQKQLSKEIKGAIATAEKSELRKVDDVLKRLDLNCLTMLDKFKQHASLAEPENTPASEIRMWDTIPRLLDLGLIWSDYNPEEMRYAYHWTYLGKKVIKRMNWQPPTVLVNHDSNPMTMYESRSNSHIGK